MKIEDMTDGLRVRIVQDIESYTIGVFKAGLTGTVCDIEEPDPHGCVLLHVRLDEHFPELRTWSNTIQVYPGVIDEWGPENFEPIAA